MIADARSPEQARPALIPVTSVKASSGSLAKDRQATALYGQMLLFFLTLLLSGMVLSQLIEEKSNKIIEVIAAAMPIDAMFVGKLFAMLAASVVGIVVWISAGALIIQFVKHGGVQTLPPPAVGWPVSSPSPIVYFGMNYLLLGAGVPDHRRAGLDRARGPDHVDAGHFRPGADLRLRLDRDRRAELAACARRGDLPAVVADGDARPRRARSRNGGRTWSRSPGRRCGSR